MKINKKKLTEIVKLVLKESEVITLPRPEVKPREKQAPTRRHNPLRPPKEAPQTRPKGIFSENEKIVDDITKRFVALKKGKH